MAQKQETLTLVGRVNTAPLSPVEFLLQLKKIPGKKDADNPVAKHVMDQFTKWMKTKGTEFHMTPATDLAGMVKQAAQIELMRRKKHLPRLSTQQQAAKKDHPHNPGTPASPAPSLENKTDEAGFTHQALEELLVDTEEAPLDLGVFENAPEEMQDDLIDEAGGIEEAAEMSEDGLQDLMFDVAENFNVIDQTEILVLANAIEKNDVFSRRVLDRLGPLMRNEANTEGKRVISHAVIEVAATKDMKKEFVEQNKSAIAAETDPEVIQTFDAVLLDQQDEKAVAAAAKKQLFLQNNDMTEALAWQAATYEHRNDRLMAPKPAPAPKPTQAFFDAINGRRSDN